MVTPKKCASVVCILFIFIFYSPTPLYSQYQSKFHRLGTEDGLSENVVYAIHQDHHGYLWVGTWDGLNRYDGYTFKKFFHDPLDSLSLSGNTINCIYEDPHQQLWIGTNGGLCRYDSKTGKFMRIPRLGAIDRFSVITISGLDDSKFFVHTGNVLFLFDSKTFSAVPINLKKEGKIQTHTTNISFTRDKKGLLYTTHSTAKSGLDLYVFDQSDGSFKSLKHPLVNLPAGYENAAAIHIAFDKKGQLWMVTDRERIFVFDSNGNCIKFADQTLLEQHYNVQCLYNAPDGNLWIGTEQGLLQYNPVDDRLSRYSSASDPNSPGSPVINCVYRDRSDVVWAGTLNGLNKLLPAPKKFRHITTKSEKNNQLFNDFILGLHGEGENTIRIQYISGIKHFSRLDPANMLTRHFSKVDYSLKEFIKETIIPGSPETRPGAVDSFRRHIDKQISIFFPPRLITGSGWRIWYADFNSFGYYDRDSNGLYFQRQIRSFIGEVYDIQWIDNSLWIATATEGLFAYNTVDGKVSHYMLNAGDPNSIRSNEVLCFLSASDENLWIGTKGGGLNYFDRKERSFKSFTTADGLCNNTIYCMVMDDEGLIWLGTSNGLSRFDPSRNEFRNYFRNDGLINSEFNRYSALKTSDGRLFFGGMNGIDYFHPAEVIDNFHASQVMITDVKVFNESVNPSFLQSLDHTNNFVSFEFATMDFRNPVVNKFAYKLEGVDKDWVFIEKRNFVGYPALQPGRYKFMLKGANSDGVWNEKPVEVSFLILTPWWKQWWFYTLVVLIMASMLYALYSFRIRQLKKVMLLRTKISRDLHDEVGATLTSISFLSEVAKKELNEETSHAPTLDKIGEYSRNMIAEMNDIVWAINPANDKFDKIVDRMQNFASPLLALRNIEFSFTADESLKNTPLSMQQRKNLYLVFKEAINNAVKYSDASSVLVKIRRSNHSISMEIYDNGTGFNANRARNGNGLDNMRGRMKEINGKFFIGTYEGGGTQIQAEIPITQNAD